MNIEVKKIVCDQFSRTLMALRSILKKAQEHAKERKFDENLFLQLRVAPDMFPLVRQVQIATDAAKGAAARLTHREIPKYEDNETTLQALIERVERTIEYVRSSAKEDFQNYRDHKFSTPYHTGRYMTGDEYLISHAIPNVMFHTVTTYNLLRGAGVIIGKADFLGEQNWLPKN